MSTRWTGIVALVVLSLLEGGTAHGFARITKATQPTALYVISTASMTTAERTMIATLQGIVTRTSSEQIYIHPNVGGYDTWLQDLESNYAVARTDVSDPWWLVDYFQPLLAGYLLYQAGNDSINAATSLAGIEDAIAVETSLESTAISNSLSLVADLRGLDEAWVYTNHGNRLSPVAAFEQKEPFDVQLRDYAVLSQALTFYDGNSAFRDAVVDGLDDDAVVFGWGDASAGEDVFVGASSERGVSTLAADHAHNLSSLSGIPTQSLQQQTHGTATAQPGVHYASFLMTDGDNIQWMLGDFPVDSRWYGSPRRGDFDMGWGIPPSLVELAPSVMSWYYANAATGPGRDFFVVGPSGGGYIYPSRYPGAALQAHVDRLATWMGMADLNLVQILDSGAFESIPLWDVYTAKPEIDGLIYLEYADYSAGAGAVQWSNGKPVIAPRGKLWQGLPSSDAAAVIDLLNNALRDASSPEGYSIIVVAAWSESLDSVQTVIDGLAPEVHVVTPEELAQLVTDDVPHDVAIHHDYTSGDFQSADIALSGDAFWATDNDPLFSPHPNRLRLTSNGTGLNGSAWLTSPIDPSRSWTTTYRFQISYPANGGADGFGFHIQSDGLTANPGYLGASSNPHLSVVIDTWNNGPEGTDESLKVILNGSQIHFNDLLDFGPDPNPGSSPTVFRCELAYSAVNQELRIRMFDEGGSDFLYNAVGVDLSDFGPSYVGFSATTGASSENHDIRTWSLAAAAPVPPSPTASNTATPTVTPTSTPTVTPTPTGCGNGVVDTGEGEECDDGNQIDGDGCQTDCTISPVHDSVVQPLRRLKVTIGTGAESATRRVRIVVANGDLEPEREDPGHTVRLIGDDGDCPPGTISTGPDFDKRVEGQQDSFQLKGGRRRTAIAEITVAADAFLTLNHKSPARCTAYFSAVTEIPAGSQDPTPENNVVPLEINVIDRNDEEIAAPQESVLESTKAITVRIRKGADNSVRRARLLVTNADLSPQSAVPGRSVTLQASDGDCPAGTVGVPDFDRSQAGAQPSRVVRGGGRASAVLSLIARSDVFHAGNHKSPGRCTAVVSVVGTDGDGSNDAIRVVIDVYDRND